MSEVDEQLSSYLADRLGVGAVRIENIEQISVGWSHETWLFSAVLDVAAG